MTDAFYGILIPFLGTSLGAASVFFLKQSLGTTSSVRSPGLRRA